MFNLDYITKEDKKVHNPNWPETPDHPYRILLVGGVINHEPDTGKIYLYAKDPYETKYQLLISKRESTGIKYSNDSKAFIEYSNDMDDIYKNIKEYNANKQKILIVFDDVIADMLINKNVTPIVTELFIRGRKLNISLVFITQSYIAVPKNRLNSAHYFVLKISNQREAQHIKKAKISALSSGKIDKYEFLTFEEILSSDTGRILELAKFIYSSAGEAFGKQIKATEDQGEKQVKALGSHGKQLVRSSEEES